MIRNKRGQFEDIFLTSIIVVILLAVLFGIMFIYFYSLTAVKANVEQARSSGLHELSSSKNGIFVVIICAILIVLIILFVVKPLIKRIFSRRKTRKKRGIKNRKFYF